ncbi:hypothetical protein M3Y94_01293300 [Aphelenchoides besseyi]|nr:hypothetical protein M3Y94_01293300 [Aphelenchoides besseyi]KAI6217600.1 hypothetical protein M3Y95_01206500 [Aphelenchoides besseyi]
MFSLRTFHFYFEIVIFAISYLLNMTVIILALKLARKTMKEYSSMLIANAVVDMVYTLITFVTMEMVDVERRMMFFISDSPLKPQSYVMRQIFAMSWCIGSFILTINVPLQFIYRYSLLCLSSPLRPRQLLGIYCAMLAYVCIHTATFFLTVEPDDNNLESILRENPVFADEKLEYVVWNGNHIVNSLQFADVQVITFGCYAIIAWTGYKTQKKLTESISTMRSSTVAAQRQMTKLMIMQAAYPFVTLVFPLAFGCLMTLFGVSASWGNQIMVLAISLIPILNAFSVILVIPSFRRAIRRILLGDIIRVGAETSVSSGPTANRQSKSQVVSTII